MKKYYFLIIATLILGLVLTGCSVLSDISQVPATDQSEVSSLTKDDSNFDVECPAAPAVAGLLLEAAGIDNRYGTGKNGGNFIKEVANEMGPETFFGGVDKCYVCEYEYEIATFLNKALEREGNIKRVVPRMGTLDPVASGATATDNADGTVTLEITVLDLCGNGISGLDPLSAFSVFDSVIGGPYYFGTGSIPDSTDWNEVDGVYTVILNRNLFSARPAGYEDGWYRIWSIYVQDELVQENLQISTTYYAVGGWKMDLFISTTLIKRFIIINTQVDGSIGGFFGVGYDPEGNPTGTITGTINGCDVYMFYERTDIVTNYTAEFWGTIATSGNLMSGIWTSGTWNMVRQ